MCALCEERHETIVITELNSLLIIHETVRIARGRRSRSSANHSSYYSCSFSRAPLLLPLPQAILIDWKSGMSFSCTPYLRMSRSVLL
jgi:hypothetical protein